MMVTPYVRQDRSRSKPASNGKLGASQNFSCQVAGESLRQVITLYQCILQGKSAMYTYSYKPVMSM